MKIRKQKGNPPTCKVRLRKSTAAPLYRTQWPVRPRHCRQTEPNQTKPNPTKPNQTKPNKSILLRARDRGLKIAPEVTQCHPFPTICPLRALDGEEIAAKRTASCMQIWMQQNEDCLSGSSVLSLFLSSCTTGKKDDQATANHVLRYLAELSGLPPKWQCDMSYIRTRRCECTAIYTIRLNATRDLSAGFDGYRMGASAGCWWLSGFRARVVGCCNSRSHNFEPVILVGASWLGQNTAFQ